MKKIFTLALLIFSFTIIVGLPIYASETEHVREITIDYNSKMQVINNIIKEYNKTDDYYVNSVETIFGFSNNTFTLYTLKPIGYFIVDDTSGEMTEGSFETLNPYGNSHNDGRRFYLGPLNYFVQQGDRYYSVTEQKLFNYSVEMETASRQLSTQLVEHSIMKESLNYEYQPRGSGGNGSTEGSTTDSAGFTVINEHEYFRKLTTFPNNNIGTCGFVALAILLGYLDTFHNVNTIPNINIIVNGTSDKLMVLGETPYLPDANNRITLDKWTKMPGTNNHLHDLLFNYGHYLHYSGWDPADWFSGYGVDAYHLAATFRDYRDAYILASNRSDYQLAYGRFFNTHSNTKSLIDEGIPTIIVMSSYSAEGVSQTKWHDVVAYGYKDDKYLAHFGWSPGDNTFTEIIINSATIQSYFAIRYTGSYRSAKNTKIIGISQDWYVDGKGIIITSSSC